MQSKQTVRSHGSRGITVPHRSRPSCRDQTAKSLWIFCKVHYVDKTNVVHTPEAAALKHLQISTRLSAASPEVWGFARLTQCKHEVLPRIVFVYNSKKKIPHYKNMTTQQWGILHCYRCRRATCLFARQTVCMPSIWQWSGSRYPGVSSRHRLCLQHLLLPTSWNSNNRHCLLFGKDSTIVR